MYYPISPISPLSPMNQMIYKYLNPAWRAANIYRSQFKVIDTNLI